MNWNCIKLFGIGLTVLLLGCAPSPSVSVPASESVDSPATTAIPTVSQAIEAPQSLPLTLQFEAAGQIIQLEEAITPRQQQIGLMYRRSLADDRGMIFPSQVPHVTRFWMRNTLIPLDMVFLLNGEIQAIEANVPPCTTPPCPSYGPSMAVNQVIELRGGRAAELGLQVGQQLRITAID